MALTLASRPGTILGALLAGSRFASFMPVAYNALQCKHRGFDMVGGPLEQRYVIVGALGRSEVATSFVARGVGADHDRWWILKLPRRNVLPTDRDARGFIEDAQTLARLSHDHLGPIADAGAFAPEDVAMAPFLAEQLPGAVPAPFVAFPYLPGETLSRVLAAMAVRERLMIPELAAYLMAAVCDGLEYALGEAAHVSARPDSVPRGVVHGNLAKHNVFITFLGSVKVLDIGIESALHLDRVRMSPTLRTVQHLAPERIAGMAPTPASDIYSVGVLLWESVAGQPMIRGRDVAHCMQLIRETDPPLLSTISPDVPRDFATIVQRALAREPSQRYASPYSLARDLRQFLALQRATLSAPELARIMLDLFGQRALETDPISRMTPVAPAPQALTRHASISRASIPPPPPTPERRPSNAWAEAVARRDGASPSYDSRPPTDPRGASFLDAGLQQPQLSIPPLANDSSFDLADLRRPSPRSSSSIVVPQPLPEPIVAARPMTAPVALDLPVPELSAWSRSWPLATGLTLMAASLGLIWMVSRRVHPTAPVVDALPGPMELMARPVAVPDPTVAPVPPPPPPPPPSDWTVTPTRSAPADDDASVPLDAATATVVDAAIIDTAVMVLDAGEALDATGGVADAAGVARAPRPAEDPDAINMTADLARDGQAALQSRDFYNAEKLLTDCVQFRGPRVCLRDLAEVYENQQRRDDAIKMYKRYVKATPRAADRPDIEARIAKLEAS